MKKMDNKTRERVSTILFIIAGIIFVYYIYVFILFPAHLSVVAVCDYEKFQEKYSDDYFIEGQLSIGRGGDGSGEMNESAQIEIQVIDEGNIPVIKHELCHLRQYEQGRLWSNCEFPVGKFLTEIECYSIQRLWEMKIYVEDLF